MIWHHDVTMAEVLFVWLLGTIVSFAAVEDGWRGLLVVSVWTMCIAALL